MVVQLKSFHRGLLIAWTMLALYLAMTVCFSVVIAVDQQHVNQSASAVLSLVLLTPIFFYFIGATARTSHGSYRKSRIALRLLSVAAVLACVALYVWSYLSFDGKYRPGLRFTWEVIVQFGLSGVLMVLLGFSQVYLGWIKEIEFPNSKKPSSSVFFFSGGTLLILVPIVFLIPGIDQESYAFTALCGAGVMTIVAFPLLCIFCFVFWFKLRNKLKASV